MKKNERYERNKEIQVGAFGTVWLCHDKKENIDVAMKECDIDEISQQEINSLEDLKHPNIIKILDHYQSSIFQYIILEYGGTDLQTIIENMTKNNTKLEMKQVQFIMKNILQGLTFIHEKGYVHRDIKPANVMISDDWSTVKLIDFGYCRKVEGRPLTPSRFTNIYAPLDCLLGMEKYNEKMDIWAAGCVLGQMLKGSPIFNGDCQIAVIMDIITVLGTPDKEDWPEMKDIDYFDCFQLPNYKSTINDVLPKDLDDSVLDLLKKMLTISQSHRISAKDALSHPFFEIKF